MGETYHTEWMEWTISVWMSDLFHEWLYIASKGGRMVSGTVIATNRVEAARMVAERLQDE